MSATELDFALPVLDSVEAIAVGLAFAKAMDCAYDSSTLKLGFRWSGLRDRELTSWSVLDAVSHLGGKWTRMNNAVSVCPLEHTAFSNQRVMVIIGTPKGPTM